jgi:hypothetical protein
MSYENFRKELTKLINRESIDARVGCPDDVLADFLCGCAINFKVAIKQNTPERKWYPAYEDGTAPL